MIIFHLKLLDTQSQAAFKLHWLLPVRRPGLKAGPTQARIVFLNVKLGRRGREPGGRGGWGGTQPKGILLNSFNTCSLSNTRTREPQTLKQQPQRQRQISRPKWVGITVTLQLHIYTLLSTNLSANFRSFQGGQRARRAAEIKAVSLSREGHSAPSSVATPAFLRPHARRPRRGAGSLRAGVARGRPAAPGRDPRSRRPPRAPPWPRRFRA